MLHFRTCRCGTRYQSAVRDECAHCAGLVCACGAPKQPEQSSCRRPACKRAATMAAKAKAAKVFPMPARRVV